MYVLFSILCDFIYCENMMIKYIFYSTLS